MRLPICSTLLTPGSEYNELGTDQGIEHDHDTRSSYCAGMPVLVRLLTGLVLGDIWVDGDPRTCENGDKTTPDDVPNCSAIAQVGTLGKRTVIDDRRQNRCCEGSSKGVDNGEKEEHGSGLRAAVCSYSAPGSFERTTGANHPQALIIVISVSGCKNR